MKLFLRSDNNLLQDLMDDEVDQLKDLLDGGMSPNISVFQMIKKYSTGTGNTDRCIQNMPLYLCAAYYGAANILQLLEEKGADVQIKVPHSFNLSKTDDVHLSEGKIHGALDMLFDGLSNVDALRVLCAQGWDINERLAINNQTFLYNILMEMLDEQSFSQNSVEMVVFALQHGADVEMADEQGVAPLSLLLEIERIYGETSETQFMVDFAKSYQAGKELQNSTPRTRQSPSSFRL